MTDRPQSNREDVAAQNRRERGAAYEAEQHLPEAAECYLMGGAFSDAARVLNHLGWFYEAGLALLLYLPPGETNVLLLGDERRRLCMDASVCFARAGARPEVVALLSALGERQRAANLLSRAGLRNRAAAVMRGDHASESPWRAGVIGPLATLPGVLRRVQGVARRQNAGYRAAFVIPTGQEAEQLDQARPQPEYVPETLPPARTPDPERPPTTATSIEAVSLHRPPSTPAPPEPVMIEEGSVINGRYRVGKTLGMGGMATVFEAWDGELSEAVAIKVFLSAVENPGLLGRFRREMQISRRLIHPNIVRTHEFGLLGGARYISMERLHGSELWEYVRDVQPSMSALLRLLAGACDGLGHAHEQGIVHRDIKPSNLFVVRGGGIKVMDFGIAKATGSSRISVTGVRVGTPRYMSPEQVQSGSTVGPGADLYALGVVIYEMLTGRSVFDDRELLPLLLDHLTSEPEPPSQHNPAVPASVDAICLRLLAKDPADRHADCAELKDDLLRAAAELTHCGAQKT